MELLIILGRQDAENGSVNFMENVARYTDMIHKFIYLWNI